MLTALKKTAFIGFFISVALFSKAQLVITPQSNAQALAQHLVGDGISISNVTITGSTNATGFFNNIGGTQIGIDSGIVLSTGHVLTSGFNTGLDGTQLDFASTIFLTPGDPQLSGLLGGSETNDAIILEFDFVPTGDTVRFQYVFSSEEYPTFTCSDFNDVFAFFISGPGITGAQNLALIPGTTIPVAINSINDGTDFDLTLCTAMGPGSPFTQYFVDNSGNGFFTHNGHTTVMTAESPVTPCQTYHLKIAIADVFDESYDSGVFLKAKSLISTPLDIINDNPVVNGVPYIVEGCTAGSIQVSRTQALSFPQEVSLYFAGTADNGTDVVTIPASVIIPANESVIAVPISPIADAIAEGIEELTIYVSYSNCGAASSVYSDSITINIGDQLSASTTTVFAGCTTSDGSITVNVPVDAGAAPYQYSLNGGANQSGNVFSDLAAGNYILSVSDATGCIYTIAAEVELNNTLNVDIQSNALSICQGGSFTPTVTSNATNFSWTPTAGVSAVTDMQPTITVNENTEYIVTASEGLCITTDTVDVTVFTGGTADAGPDQFVIAGDAVQLQASGSSGTYLWTPPMGLSATNILQPMASPTQTTTYTLEITTAQGCKVTDEVVVNVLPYCVDPMEAFTPNGDGINDQWLVTSGNCLRSARVEVFNRYGNKVFENDNYQNNWDGTYKGDPLPDGTYYFVITYQLINGKLVYLKGNVTILR